MKRLIIITTIALLAAIGVGTMTMQDPVLQAFASSDIVSQAIRAALIGLLVSFLFIQPPRSIHFRVFLGVASVALAATAPYLMAHFLMMPLDMVMSVEVAIIFAIEALELPHVATNARKDVVATQLS